MLVGGSKIMGSNRRFLWVALVMLRVTYARLLSQVIVPRIPALSPEIDINVSQQDFLFP
jgi:hypothetical protein